jgi:hypothetical protein
MDWKRCGRERSWHGLTFILLLWRIGRAPNSIPIYSYIQQDAKSHSLFISVNCSTCFGWYFHPSSGTHTTVSIAFGICHTVTAICRYRGRVGTGLSVLWVMVDLPRNIKYPNNISKWQMGFNSAFKRLRYHLSYCLEGPTKHMQHLSQASLCPSTDSKHYTLSHLVIWHRVHIRKDNANMHNETTFIL